MFLLVLFFASGTASLAYEVCWVRQFGNEFGNNVYSAAIVSAVFMCGLGIGSFGAGGWADRRMKRPGAARAMLRAYGAAELGIALLGLALAWGLPHLGGLSASLSSYPTGAHGWHELSFGSHVLRYAIAAVMITPPTLLMGATLTLLVRATIASDVSQVAWRIGMLYGANTAGAAAGAVACDALLVPRLGVLGTQGSAVAINVVVGLGALALAARHDAREPSTAKDVETPPADGETPPASPIVRSRLVVGGSIALALSGFAALGMEIVWFRFISATIGSYRSVFSLVLAVILTGIWLGAIVGGYCHRRFGRALEMFVVAQALVAVSALAMMGTFTAPTGSIYGVAVKSILAVVALPSFMAGFSFPLVNAHVQDELGFIGRRAGVMYLANTLGSVAGSIVAGLVFAPLIGSETSFAVFAACAAVAPFALVFATAAPRAAHLERLALVAAITSMIAIVVWISLPPFFVKKRFMTFFGDESAILASTEGSNEIVTVVERGPEGRDLSTNGHSMSSTNLAAQRYMRAFAHVPLLMVERPERALVVCFGVGNTLHAASLHPSIEHLEVADLSRNVLEHASFFRVANDDVLASPRVSVFIEDGRQHLRQASPGSYDLITLEPPPPMFAGVSALYSREFYDLARSRLKPGGYLTQWLPAHDIPPDVTLAMVRAFVDAFPSSALLSGMASELILIGTPMPRLELDLDRVEKALHERPGVARDLARVGLGTLTEIVGTFVANADTMRAATAGVMAVTDDRPLMEYAFGRVNELPPSLFTGTGQVRAFCPKCFVGDTPDPRVAELARYMTVLERVYVTERFQKNVRPYMIERAGVESTIARSSYLRSLIATGTIVGRAGAAVGAVDGRAHLVQAFELARIGHIGEAAEEYERGLALEPGDVDARYNLAVIYASLDREDDAVREAKKVLEAQPTHARAKAMLCALRTIGCPP